MSDRAVAAPKKRFPAGKVQILEICFGTSARAVAVETKSFYKAKFCFLQPSHHVKQPDSLILIISLNLR